VLASSVCSGQALVVADEVGERQTRFDICRNRDAVDGE